ncbi:LOG family protein [Synechococcus sp. WC101]|uniref:LOG family protein n=1 Tax=Synechococcus sp. WC101 TaxID=2964536 RepID=UPI0039C0CE47
MADSLSSLLQEIFSNAETRLKQLEHYPNRTAWLRVLQSLQRMGSLNLSRLDAKILAATLEDLEQGFAAFQNYVHQRKVTVFGSARVGPDSPEYRQAQLFAHCISQRGFMVLTGGGGGIMEAGNRGAGLENSFGLNIQLPFEQMANPVIAASDRVINFKYFFSRKLFFVKETDALVLFPGGFGTQDEAFECLTLMQTGKTKLMPLVLVDKKGGCYWKEWDEYVREHLLSRGLISPEDLFLYTLTDDVGDACQQILDFYRIFHSNRYVRELLVLRLNAKLSPQALDILNEEFADILDSGRIEQTEALPEEAEEEIAHLPRLVMHFNQRNFGRLWQMVRRINTLHPAQPDRLQMRPDQK